MTRPQWENYCSKYLVNCEIREVFGNLQPCVAAWLKIDLVLKELKNNNIVIWVDTDIHIVDYNKSIFDVINSIPYPLIFSKDDNGLCSGFFSARSVPEVKYFLELVKDCGELNIKDNPGKSYWEQSTIKFLLKKFPHFEKYIGYIPENIISHPRLGVKNETIAFHCWASGNPREWVLNQIRSYQ